MSRAGGRRRTRASRRLAPSAQKVGLPPGTVHYTGSDAAGAVSVDLLTYGPDGVERRRGVSIDEALAGNGDGRIRWVDVTGVHDPKALHQLGAALGLHGLTLEDLASVGQRPKVERFDEYLYLVMRMITSKQAPEGVPVLAEEQLSLVLAGSVLVTFQERPGDVLDPVRERLTQGRGRLRSMGADYLAYAIVDVVVDHYFRVLEDFSDSLETLESRAFGASSPRLIDDVHILKSELLHLRRAIWPTRELLASLVRAEEDPVSPAVRTYLRDAHDHAVQVLETVEVLRESANSVHDTYLAGLSHRMNEIMKLLTIIATIFIPLTFVVGVYGMNFEHMPELGWRWGYAAVWFVMLAAAVSMLAWFRRRRWL